MVDEAFCTMRHSTFHLPSCSEVSAVLSCARRLTEAGRRLQEVVNVAYTIGLDVSEAWENMGQAVMAALGSITMETMTAVVEDSLAAANITVQVAVVSSTLRVTTVCHSSRNVLC